MSIISKIRGSSIIEVVIALFIISISIALTGSLFTKVFQSSKRVLQQKAWYDLNEWSNQVKLTKDIKESIFVKDVYSLEKNALLIDESKGLWQVNMIAFKNIEDTLLFTSENDLASIQFLIEIVGNQHK
jgi:Tfp pilus assembly protein PilV